jgi:uncharacterized protein
MRGSQAGRAQKLRETGCRRRCHDGWMWVGWIEFDVLLGDVRSLKQKRSVVRPLVAELRRRFQLSVAEVDELELHRRSVIGLAAVASDRARVVAVLDEVERFVAERPEIELLSARRRLHASHDED